MKPEAFRFAWRGVVLLLTQEPNARVHLAALGFALWAAAVTRLRLGDVALVVTLSALVLGLEAVNAALERSVDLATRQRHPLAAQAKDIAAGAVLLAATAALAVAALLFLPRLGRLWAAAHSPDGLFLLVPLVLLASAWWRPAGARDGEG